MSPDTPFSTKTSQPVPSQAPQRTDPAPNHHSLYKLRHESLQHPSPHPQAPVTWGHPDKVPTLPNILSTSQPWEWGLWKSSLQSLDLFLNPTGCHPPPTPFSAQRTGVDCSCEIPNASEVPDGAELHHPGHISPESEG